MVVSWFSKRKIIILSFVLLPILAVAIPLNMSDGTEKFQGIEREVAERQIVQVEQLFETKSEILGATLKYRIEAVYPLPPEDREWCSNLGSNESVDGYYAVRVSVRTFFGITTQEFPRYDDCHDYTPVR